MSGRDARPPRSQRPRAPQPDPAAAGDTNYYQPPYTPYAAGAAPPARPPAQPVPSALSGSSQTKVGSAGAGGMVSFQHHERGERADTVEHPRRPPRMQSAYAHAAPPGADAALEGGFGASGGGANVGRKKSLVRPDREKIEPGHRQWHYRTHAAQMENENRVGVMPSTTGNVPQSGRPVSNLRRGKSLLAREEGDGHESGLALFPRGGAGLLRKRHGNDQAHERLPDDTPMPKRRGCLSDIPGPKDAWMIYCWVLTCWIPNFLLRTCGMKTPEQQRAWREKMGLISIISMLMACVGYVTFGFTQTVCGRPPNRFKSGHIDTGSVIIHGWDYDLSQWKHPRTGSSYFPGNASSPLFEGGWNVAGNDISFMFQRVNQHCVGFIEKANNSTITGTNANPNWYFPCNVYSQHGGGNSVNSTGYNTDTNCHISSTARGQLASIKPQGQVYYTWDQVRHGGRNLAVYESNVLDFDLLKWLDKSQVQYPTIFDDFMKKNGTFNGKDLSMYFLRTNQRNLGHCLEDIITVGYIDTNTIGCVASEVVLYVSLVFIIGVVGIRFGMAVVFAWFFAAKLGNYSGESRQQRMARMAEIENWTNDIYRPAPSQYRPTVAPAKKGNKKSFLPSTSRFTPSDNILKAGRPTTNYGMLDAQPQYKRATVYGGSVKNAKLTPPDSPSAFRQSRSSTSLTDPCPFPLVNVVPQPPPDYEPFGYPLAHTICLVTAYSESFEGLRTTLDSLATTDYPNSHKLILIIADGMVKGAGNDLTTPEICLTMMKDLVIPADEVEPHSYVAIADGHKRHNMAKVYAGFYEYDDATVELSKQQRVPIVLVAKVGNPLEANDAKPGNRGKRDSQIVLMAFLQKVMFDERMTTFEYEFFNSIWRVAGVSPDKYELVLCVDADTKVFPDSLSRMGACMVQDEEIMGLCGETKIANKAETWVTMIQVFEYYISHHMTKAFESMFGGVTCLPGCFSMYRIKAPKGDSGYWVPILANPDIVEHYSENVVDTLHKKNLLLLGEDRYLTTLMLKTFPRRKNMFCPSAVCKTIVPDTFSVLLSQRRRWINSTIHNLFELLLVRDLCGTFCFSMQFVVGMELGGTLVLPAAISFTLYLIIISIIPGGSNTTIPLVLLAIVLGLPGILIVITTRKMAYVGWMLVYLLSLPIWNGILPAYAFWHFDDFSWGQTRQIAGDKKGDNHGDKEGEFDSSHIVMKRWAEFERERRWKNDSLSRDSTYYERGTGSPQRYSMVSSSETFQPPSRGFDSSTTESGPSPAVPRSRYSESQRELMLPTPLSVARPQPSTISTNTGFSRSSEDGYTPQVGSSSNQRLVSSPQTQYGYDDAYEAVPTQQAYYPANASYEGYSSPRAQSPRAPPGVYNTGVRSTASAQAYVAEQQQYQRSQPHHSATYDERPRYSSDNDDRAGRRGARESYDNAAASPDAVRRVPRSRRPSSQLPAQSGGQAPPAAQSSYSRTTSPSSHPRNARSPPPFSLPPGAAPPQPSNYRSQPGAGHQTGYSGR